MKFLLMVVSFFMPSRYYLKHVPEEELDMVSYFGPFRKRELIDRENDDYADLLVYGGDKLYPVKLSWLKARGVAVLNSRKYWMETNESLKDDEPPAWKDEIQ